MCFGDQHHQGVRTMLFDGTGKGCFNNSKEYKREIQTCPILHCWVVSAMSDTLICHICCDAAVGKNLDVRFQGALRDCTECLAVERLYGELKQALDVVISLVTHTEKMLFC